MLAEISETVHASCVSVDGKGLLILGASGAGKSSLAIQLLGLGADLIADDRTILVREGVDLWAKAPASILGLIEARGVGILTVPTLQCAKICAVVDLDEIEVKRLPAHRMIQFLGCAIPCIHNVESSVFPSILLHYLRYGRQDTI